MKPKTKYTALSVLKLKPGCFGKITDISSSAEKAWQLEEVLKERIVIIDGAMGTMIQVRIWGAPIIALPQDEIHVPPTIRCTN